MKEFIRFIFSKAFVVNGLIALVVAVGIIWATLNYLDDFSLHGQSVSVPDFKGLKISELKEFIKEKELRYEISETVYRKNKPKGIVLEQDPQPDFQVKKGRKIYLTINDTVPPQKSIPNILSQSDRAAINTLISYGFQVGDMQYKPDICVGCVLSMEIKGKEINPGDRVEVGSKIDLWLGQGTSDVEIAVPNVLGFTYSEAKSYLNSKGLNIGKPNIEFCNSEKDSANAKVFKQVPESNDENVINLGNIIDLFFTCDSLKIQSILPDTSRIDTLNLN